MKQLFSLAILFMVNSINGYAQNGDMQTNIVNLNGTIHLGDTAVIQLNANNHGASNYPANSLQLSFSAPSNGRIIGVVADSPATIFTVVQLTSESSANAITFVNTGGALLTGPLPGSDYDIYVYMVGVSAGGPHTFLSHIDYNQDPNHGGSFSNVQYGDMTTTDNDGQTSLTVTTPLPLDFTDINAVWRSNDALVNWDVAREIDNDYFTIERSFDGKSFTQVGNVKSIGNHQTTAKYTYTDKDAKGGTIDKVAYRVKQVDHNGKSTTSKIVWLTNKGGKNSKAYIYPNPVTTHHSFAFVYENNEDRSGDLNINILDAHGKLVYTTIMPVIKGKNEANIDVSTLAAGAYFVRYANASMNINGTIRIIKE